MRHEVCVVTTSLAVQRFFRTPKGLLLIVLVALTVLAAPFEGVKLVWPGLLASILAASLIDAVILRLKRDAWEFPSGAILTALLVAMVLSPRVPWYETACAAALGVLSKYAFRTKSANVFNPAALALVIAFYVFQTAQNWWGALPGITSYALVALFAAGVFITDRVNKMPLVMVFLGVYYLLFSLTAFFTNPAPLAEIFRPPDLQAVLFFAFFMLTDPPTSPVKYSDQIVCGVLVAVASYAFFELLGAACFLLAGVLIGNIWEARRRHFAARGVATSLASPFG
jgi:Na+-translocating ferredoxin:NAD+ oxidoreductase RnfD subunit